MEQFVLFTAEMYNIKKSLNIQAVKKRELPNYQAEQNATYRTDSPEKGMNKTLFSKALSSGQNFISFSYDAIKFSDFELDGVKTGVLLTLLTDCVVETQTLEKFTLL